jgi:hypothetical protein
MWIPRSGGLIWDERGNDHGFSAEIIRPEFEFVSATDELCPSRFRYSNFEFELKIQFLVRVVGQDIREAFSKRMSGITGEFLGLDSFRERILWGGL